MSYYNLKFNKDDSLIRHVIVALLADLNKKLYIHRQINNDDRVKVDIPFFYRLTGDDQFLRDNFLFNGPNDIPSCVPIPANKLNAAQMADGNYDYFPKGVLSLTSLDISTSKALNKRIRSNYHKLDNNGFYTQFNSEMIMVPIELGFEVTIEATTQLDILKITENIITLLYKTNVLEFEVGHLDESVYKLPLAYNLPDGFTPEIQTGFSFEVTENPRLNFNITAQTFIPQFDYSSEYHNGKRIFEIESNTHTKIQCIRKTDTNNIDKHIIK